MEEKILRMKELVPMLSRAARAYYQESREIMSNYDYDQLYDELLQLEKETGTILSGSPTQKVGYEVLSELPKEAHEAPMLSLDKTKSVDDLAEWLGGQEGLLSWKLDGLTIVLTYEGGKLVKAVTRGNGEIGEVPFQFHQKSSFALFLIWGRKFPDYFQAYKQAYKSDRFLLVIQNTF